MTKVPPDSQNARVQGQLTESGRQCLAEVRRILAATASGQAAKALHQVMTELKRRHPDWYWVGIYRLADKELVVGPYEGPRTDHVRIPVGRGVCGTAVAEDRNQVIGDVTALDNYLACNLATKSEIVVLIREHGSRRILGQIDVDSTRANGFGPADEALLEEVAALLAPRLPGLPAEPWQP